jgi:hypothetical protein
MLTENDVVDATCKAIENEGYTINQKLNTIQKGIDVVGEKNGIKIYIEAKGGTSSKLTTNRYGKPFNGNQVKDHVANALLKTCETISKYHGPNTEVAMAFPDNEEHRDRIAKIQPVIRKLNIILFWVKEDKSVEKV